MQHKFSMHTAEARPDEYVLAIMHFDKVVALIASRGAHDPEAQAQALIEVRSHGTYRDSYEIKRVKVEDLRLTEDVPTKRYVAEVTAQNETEAREKFRAGDVKVRETNTNER